ncbi:MAG: cell division protein ZapA [Flavobacteriales bacterium]|nr:cell division protein ZapA [Flavobacteriales bacterium]NQX99198.1 cell division protein ZapA [Flavobacteriales bacterium]
MGELSIKIKIANRVYPLTVDASEEEGIRNAAEKINQSIGDFERLYDVKDKQDLIAMAALKVATRNFDLEKKGILDSAGIEDDLMAVEQLLDQHL